MTGRRQRVVGALASLVVAACTAAPAGTVAPSVAPPPTPGPVAGSSGSPVPDHAERLAAAFLGHVQDPKARYRMDQTLTVVIGQSTSTAVSHSDVAGLDLKVVSDNTDGGTTTHVEYLQSGGSAYSRTGDEDWRAVGPAAAQPGLFPFMKGSDLRYAGHRINGGAFTNSFSLAQEIPIGTSVAEAFGVMGGTATVIAFDCFVQSDGVPLSVQMGFRLDSADGSAAGQGTIVQDYAEFGGDIVIDPPIT